MKTTRHSLMAKGILVLLSLLILVFVFTYTWFVDPDEPVTASGLSLSARNTTTDFEYAIGFSNSQTGGAYKHTAFTNDETRDLNLEELTPSDDPTKTVNLLYDYNPTDLTGNGVTLVRPAMSYGNWSINSASRNYSIAEENVQYITFDMIFRTKVSNTTIRLDSGSFAKGNCESYSGDGSLLTDSSSFNKDRKYGDFSTDAIVGAVRVAFLEYIDHGESADTIVGTKQTEYESTPLLLWIPRPDLYLDNNPTGDALREKEISGWALRTNVDSNTTFNLRSDAQVNPTYSTYTHQYYNVFEAGQNETPAIVPYTGAIASTLDTDAPNNTHKVTFGTTNDLITLDHINDVNDDDIPDDEYYYGKVRVRIWLEGTDSESRRALAGGKFSVGFHVTG